MRGIVIALVVVFLIPCSAVSMTLMTDAELATVTGRIGIPLEKGDLLNEQVLGDPDTVKDTLSHRSASDLSPETAGAAGTHIHPQGQGIAIYIVDVLFDVYIGNIAYGDTDSWIRRFPE